MKTPPVSFGSIMVFTLNDGRPKAPIPLLIRTAFLNNDALKKYQLLDDTYEYHGRPIDGLAHNITADFCKFLDREYAGMLPLSSNKVVLTEADFYTGPVKKQRKYFITAPTESDEKKIHMTLGKGLTLLSAKFGHKA